MAAEIREQTISRRFTLSDSGRSNIFTELCHPTWHSLRACFVVMMRQGGPLGVLLRKYSDRERWLQETRLMLDEYYLGIKRHA